MSRRRSGRRNSSGSGATKILLTIAACIIALLLVKNLFPSNSADSATVASSEYDAVCLVAGNVANSPAPDFSSAESAIKDVFNATAAGDTPNICMYSATANPYAIELSVPQKGQNQAAITSQLKTLIRKINESAQTSPSEGGANYYEAILQAADYLKSSGAKNPLIVVYGSGLSDSGTVDFAFGNLLNKDKNYITSVLSSTNIRKNGYSNISLIWLGAGQTVNNDLQPTLSNTWRNKVKDIYETALAYIGITDPEFKSVQISDSTTSVSTDFYVNPTQPGLESGTTISLTENIAKFKPDSAELSNYDEVKDRLSEFASGFNDSDNLKLKITGYQTYCATSKTLSENRATTIRNILVNNLGVDAAKIEVSGVAGPQDNRTEDPYCGTTGVATEHRTVIIEVVED